MYLEVLVLGGLLAAPVFSGITYLDASRRNLPSSAYLARVLSVGAISFGGFLVPYVFHEQFQYAYFHLLKPRPIAVSPYEFLAVSLATGAIIGVIATLLALVSNRYSPFQGS